jgi:hypothetical protein
LATTCDELSVLVDHSHSLPSDYVLSDLVPLQDYGVPTLGSAVLRRGAAEHLGRLVEGAPAGGEEPQLSHERLVSPGRNPRSTDLVSAL